MSSPYSSPDQLAQRLDRALPPGQSSLPPFTSDPLVNTAVDLSRLKLPALAPNASTRIEGRMLSAFSQQYRRRPTTSRRSVVSAVARWALVASMVCVLLIAGLTPAIAASVPGEPLYPVKQFYERVELAAARSHAAKATVYLWHADRRTQESLVLLERKQFNLDLIDAALADIDAASKLSATLRASAHLRGELLQIQTLMGFVLQDARETGLTSQEAISQRVEQVDALGKSDLLLPLPAQEHNPNVVATNTSAAPIATTTPSEPPMASDELAATTTCERGQSCRVLDDEPPTRQPTSRPTHEPPTRQPTSRPTHEPPTRQPTQVSNSEGGNSTGAENGGGNGNGGGNSAGGNSNGNENNGGDNSAGGNSNGNGNGGGNSAGGNSNGNGNGGGSNGNGAAGEKGGKP